MKKLWIGLGILLLIIFSLYGWVKGTYNTMVTMDEEVKTAWSQVENQYQRRLDLIPNVVSTVKGYAEHEQETFTAVTQARAQATQTNIDVRDIESMAAFQSQQGSIGSALSRLLVAVEAYPELKANQNFLALQTELEGTENRISTERMRYNETAKTYNIYVRQFPNNMLASLFDFGKVLLFDAEAGAERAPEVQF